MHRLAALLVALGALLVAAPGARAAESYDYTVEHPTYGRIGTYRDTVERKGEEVRIDTQLRVAVTVLGITLHREEADRSEIWRGDRLISFRSHTLVNGDTIEVSGEARGDGFAITSPAGKTVVPAEIYTSSPWSVAHSHLPKLLVSTKTGKVVAVKASGSEPAEVPAAGGHLKVRHFHIESDKPQDVWLDARGVPVRFRTVEAGSPIDFILAPSALAALAPR
jgi:Family of unknown function (DUF6134)